MNDEQLERSVYKEIMESCESPSEVNSQTLMRIVKDNENTEYGRRNGFSGIASVEDFKRTVPISTFDEYADLVYREIKKGEKGLMTSYDIVAYNKTSGTSGNIKKIPMSSNGLRDLTDLTAAYVYGLAGEKLGRSAVGKGMWLTEATSCSIIDNGIMCTGLSGHLTIDWHLNRADMYTSPAEASKPVPDTDTKYLHARFGIAERDLTHICCTFSSFILDIFRYLEKNWEMLCDDIEKGTINDSIRMPDDVRNGLESRIVPMPDRAAELRRVFSDGFDSTIAKRLWPKLSFVNCVCTGVFSAYMKNLRDCYIGDIPVVAFGLTASEGVMTVAYDINETDSVPVPSRMFYEFLPLDADESSGTVDIGDLEVGKDYEIVITTSSGLYRYRTRDAVRIHGFHGKMPTLDYLFRIDMCANLNGEKTYEPALRKGMELASEELGFRCLDFCVYPNTDITPPRYEFFIEMIDFPDNIPLNRLAECIEDKLKIANPIMNHPVYSEMCGRLVAHILQEETYLLYHDKMVLRGGSSTQVKPVKVIMNEAQLRFFRVLIDRDFE